jgi:hypothetical protein
MKNCRGKTRGGFLSMRAGRAVRATLVLVLTFLLAGLPATLLAQGFPPSARRGADIVVVLISPGTISGELIGINSEKMVIQVGANERTVAIAEIDSVRVFRESLKPLGLVVGLVAGGVIGYAVGKKKPTGTETKASSSQWIGAGVGVLLGGGAGWGIGSLLTKDKVYQLRDATPDKLSAAIEALRKKARVPDFK